MKIKHLFIENVMRIKSIDFSPEGNVIIISGKNDQGKSSIFEAIKMAFQYAMNKVQIPIRRGEEDAQVIITTESYIITRKWTSNTKSYLEVKSLDNAVYKSPQALLDKLKSDLTFDPLAFKDLDSREQVQWLLRFAGKESELSVIDNDRELAYNARTETNKEFKKIKTYFDEIAVPEDGLPDNEISIDDILITKDVAKVQNENRQAIIDKANSFKLQSENTIKAIAIRNENITKSKAKIVELERQIQQEKVVISTEELRIKEGENQRDTQIQWYKEKLAESNKIEFIDLDSFDSEIRQANLKNEKIRTKQYKWKLENQMGDLRVESDNYTTEIEELDKQKKDILQSIEFPVEGLSFDENGITINGIPFEQCSDSSKIKTSIAMGMSMNPELKVMMTTNADKLDSDSMKMIYEIAEKEDYQVWLERVEDDSPSAIIIEDGIIKKEEKTDG